MEEVGHFLGQEPSQREALRRQVVCAAGKKPAVSLSRFPEVNKQEIEHELAVAATNFWAQAGLGEAVEGRYPRSLDKTDRRSYVMDGRQMFCTCGLLRDEVIGIYSIPLACSKN